MLYGDPSREGLSEQALAIMDYIKSQRKYEPIRKFIAQFPIFDQDSVKILRWYILSGDWTSTHYGYGWTAEQEIWFWKLVYEKRHPQSGLAILTLAESYRGNGLKTLSEVMDLYFEAIDIDLQHYFSLTMDGEKELDELLKNPAFNKKCLLVELNIWENMYKYSIEEIEQETPLMIKKCNGDPALESFIRSKIDELIKRKKGFQ